MKTGVDWDVHKSHERTIDSRRVSISWTLDASPERNRMKRAVVSCFLISLALLLAYLFYVAAKIEQQSTSDEAQAADVIVVMGAAEYRGRPSQVLQARLNHALVLYLKGFAPYILTTGGSGGDPDFTEGEVGRAYLTRHGVHSEAVITENKGATTPQSVNSAAETMRRMNLHSCILVSDGYHIYRAKRLLEAHGLKVYGSPRPSQRSLSAQRMRVLYFKQAVGFVLWQVGINL